MTKFRQDFDSESFKAKDSHSRLVKGSLALSDSESKDCVNLPSPTAVFRMMRNFPLFNAHIDLAHQYWEKILKPGDFAIDATCGNGHDTLKLAEILLKKEPFGSVIAIDIQEEAIARTKDLLQSRLPDPSRHIHLYCQSHASFPPLSSKHPIRLIVYNLGYLPKGNKQLTTQTKSTLESIHQALNLIMPNGAISITCYPGHEEGAREEKALARELSLLPADIWNICHHRFPNRAASPSLFLIQKNQV